MSLRHKWLSHALAVITALAIFDAPAQADVISDWNTKAEAIATEKRLIPALNVHNMALLHVAMFEAVNAIEPRYAPYRLKLTAERTDSKEAAAAIAAYTVLTALYPDQHISLDALLMTSLGSIADGGPKARGIEVGKKAATAVLTFRADDGADAPEAYRPYTAAGVYVPTVVPISSTYGAVRPWVMTSGAQLRPGPPPALDSATWTNDVNEVREMGRRTNSRRTTEQTDIGRFWFIAGPPSWNPIVRQLAALRKLDIVDSARLFALVALATDDACVAVFDAKYTYNFWRPMTAIRNADLTGNKATPRDALWLPLGDAPLHPEYPCAHCITSAAAGGVLESLFGNDIPEVSMTSASAPGVTRRWTRLRDYVDEIAVARIYAGFHYRFSNQAAQEMGRKIAALTMATQLRNRQTDTESRR